MRDERQPSGPSARDRLRSVLLRGFARSARPFVRASGPNRTGPVRRVLLIRPDHMGDYLFATPALERWEECAPPHVETIVSVGPWNASLAERGPLAGRVETYPYPGFARQPKDSLIAPYQAALRQARRLRHQEIDLAVVMRFDHWWGGLLAYLAGIPLRVGYATDPLAAFLNRAIPYAGTVHEVQRNLALFGYALALCGARTVGQGDGGAGNPPLVFRTTPEDQARAEALLAELGPGAGKRVVIIHPGAGAAVKLWPAERFAAVADALVDRWEAAILLTGVPSELGRAREVAGAMRQPAQVLVGRTDVGTLAALMERSSLVIGSDSGPLHLAVAVGTPSVHLYGPVDPAVFGPWTSHPERHPVIMADCPCAPCNRLAYAPAERTRHRCMETIEVEQVLAVVGELLTR